MTVRPQDLGGRRGFGPVPIEQDEPVFHADWEASVIAGILATISAGLYNVDQFREGIDELEPLSYLALGYYRRWLHTLEVNCVKSGVFSAEELERRIAGDRARRADAAGRATTRSPRTLRDLIYLSAPAQRSADAPPAFAVGDGVRGRVLEGARHARIPVYAQGKRGVVPARSIPRSPIPTRAALGAGRAARARVLGELRRPRAVARRATSARRSSSTSGSRTSSRAEGARMSTGTREANRYAALRTRAIESLLIEKGLLSEEAVDVVVEAYGSDIGPLHGARVVARAWTDPAFKERLLEDATAAARELGRRRLRLRVRARRREHRGAAQPRRVHALLVLSVGPARPSARLVQVARVPLARRARAARRAARVRRGARRRRPRSASGTRAPTCATSSSRAAPRARTIWPRTSSRRSSRASR